MNKGQMDRSNENTTSICLDDWGKPWKNPVRLVGSGIWIGTAQIRVQCVTTAPPHPVAQFLFRRIDIYYIIMLKILLPVC